MLRSEKHVEPNKDSATPGQHPQCPGTHRPTLRKKQVRFPDVVAARCLYIAAHAAARQSLHKLPAHLFRRPAAYHVLPLPLERFQKQGAHTQHRDAATTSLGSSRRTSLQQHSQTSCAHAVAADFTARVAAAAARVVAAHMVHRQAAAGSERVAFGAGNAAVDGFLDTPARARTSTPSRS